MRLFFAFPLTDAEKERIGEWIAPGKQLYPNLNWVKPENMHLTLHFLGDLDPGRTEACIHILKNADIDNDGFTVRYEGFGRFPTKGIPRVFFIKLTGGTEECGRFHKTLGELLQPVTVVDRKPFVPHITAARIKGKRDVYPDVGKLGCPSGTISVTRLVLFESVLRAGGAVYREVAGKELTVKSIQ